MGTKIATGAVLEEARNIVEQIGSEPEKVIPLLQEIQKDIIIFLKISLRQLLLK